MAAEVTALSLWVTVQVGSAITKSVPPLGIFRTVQRSPTAQPPQNSISKCEMPLLGGDKVLSEDMKCLKVWLFFPWCAKSNAMTRFAWWWKFLLQWLNRVTRPPAPRKQRSWSLGANVLLGNAGRRWICLCLYVAFKTALCNLTRVCVCACTDVQSEITCFIRTPYFALVCFRIFDFVNYNQWSSMFQSLWHRNSLVSWSVR